MKQCVLTIICIRDLSKTIYLLSLLLFSTVLVPFYAQKYKVPSIRTIKVQHVIHFRWYFN